MYPPNRQKKSPRSEDLELNPPKEEGGGDNLGMSGYEDLGPEPVMLRVFPLQSPCDIR
jgi:hypothetical protein